MEDAKCDLGDFLKSTMASLPLDFQAEVQIEQETPAMQQNINAIQGENHLDVFSAFFNETFKEVDEVHITKPETSTKREEPRKPDVEEENKESRHYSRQSRNETNQFELYESNKF